MGSTDWEISSPLPHHIYAGKMITISNIVYFLGNSLNNNNDTNNFPFLLEVESIWTSSTTS